MAVDVLQAAKCLARHSGWKYSNLELQKLIYISHLFFIGDKNSPLVEGEFEAWRYGPVHPFLYSYIQGYGSKSIPKSVFKKVRDLGGKYEEEIDMLHLVARSFPHPSGPKLISITHWKHGAWAEKYSSEGDGALITDSDIKKEYQERCNRQWQAEDQ